MLVNLKKGKGTLGQLMTNDSLFNNLNKTVLNIDSLVDDLKKNPRKYLNFSVFGSKK